MFIGQKSGFTWSDQSYEIEISTKGVYGLDKLEIQLNSDEAHQNYA